MDKLSVAKAGSDVEDMFAYVDGCLRYQRGEPRSRCTSDAERAGWDQEESRGAAAYLACMVEQDAADHSVNWTGVSDVFYNAYGDVVR